MAKMANVDGNVIENLFKGSAPAPTKQTKTTKAEKGATPAGDKPKAKPLRSSTAMDNTLDGTHRSCIHMSSAEASALDDIVLERKVNGLSQEHFSSAAIMGELIPAVLERINNGENVARNLGAPDEHVFKSVYFSNSLYKQMLLAQKTLRSSCGASATEASLTTIVRAALQPYVK